MLFLIALAGCATVRQGAQANSPCDTNENSYACQVDRYGKVGQP
ncbi:MAG TPA: hypothetical protein VIE63_00495 [Ramlibacter sp.]